MPPCFAQLSSITAIPPPSNSRMTTELSSPLVRPVWRTRWQCATTLLGLGLPYIQRAHSIPWQPRSEEHTSELQSRSDLVCRLLLEKKNTTFHSRSSRRHIRLRPQRSRRAPTHSCS